MKKIFEKKFFKKMSKNRIVPPRFFTFCVFCIYLDKCKKCKKCQNGIFVVFSRFWKRVQLLPPPCFCCKGRQSPWQKPANLYSTKCRIFMRQNPLSRVCATTRARPSGDKYFSEKNIFYSSEIFVLTRFLKKF